MQHKKDVCGVIWHLQIMKVQGEFRCGLPKCTRGQTALFVEFAQSEEQAILFHIKTEVHSLYTPFCSRVEIWKSNPAISFKNTL